MTIRLRQWESLRSVAKSLQYFAVFQREWPNGGADFADYYIIWSSELRMYPLQKTMMLPLKQKVRADFYDIITAQFVWEWRIIKIRHNKVQDLVNSAPYQYLKLGFIDRLSGCYNT